MSIIIAVLILGFIIMIHEFGHFLFAKLNGIGVLEFSLGMGPRLFGFERGGTRYSFKILPFGGSCSMVGEDEECNEEEAFGSKSVWARISVVAAGPVFNFILAFLLAMILIGVNGRGGTALRGVIDGYPAQAAGLQAGDEIVKLNGRRVHSFRDVNWYLFTHPQDTVKVTVGRTDEAGNRETFVKEIAPVYSQENQSYMLGVEFDGRNYPLNNPVQLMAYSAYEVQFWIHYVFDTFRMMFNGMVSMNDISGPVGIVDTIDTTVEETVPYGISAVILTLINLTILLSSNLGVMNLLPIPALDGGRLVFLLLEAVRGKPIDREKEGMVHMAGMMVLLGLMVLLLFNDVRKLFG
ncbi:MAG: RIP metalloprotease RseP [Clostridium sp.]|nr:RIP metalloprotease RseP [Clostridium sp.]